MLFSMSSLLGVAAAAGLVEEGVIFAEQINNEWQVASRGVCALFCERRLAQNFRLAPDFRCCCAAAAPILRTLATYSTVRHRGRYGIKFCS